MKKVKINKSLLGLSINLSAATGQRWQQIWTNEKRARPGVQPISSNESVRSSGVACRCCRFRPMRASTLLGGGRR